MAHYRETEEQVHSETLGCRDVPGQGGLREHADRGELVRNGHHYLRGPRCQYSTLYTGDTWKPVLGMAPGVAYFCVSMSCVRPLLRPHLR